VKEQMSDDFAGNQQAGTEKRLAIIVGVNKYYADSEIPELSGAENDAQEISERLKTAGNFIVQKNHLLIGRDATRNAIIKAISDIFRKSVDDCNLVIFYFSGHGIIDENNEGYIAPYDMDPQDPFVCGINMEEIRDVISKSKNKASVAMILDCCYAGIATKNAKAMAPPETMTKNMYTQQLKKLIESPSEQNHSGKGKIVLASSEANAVSREKNNCRHLDNDSPHTHGAFSFHLLEGLDGKAADPETGVITIEGLRKHIENQMNIEGRQKPMYYIADASQIESIKIALSQSQFNKKVSQLIGDVEQRLNQKIEDSNLVDIQTLTEAAKKLRELESLDPKNKERPRLVKAIDDELHMYEEPMENWLNRNFVLVRPKINQVHAGLYDNTLYSLIESLSYNELKNFDQVNLQYLIILCSEIITNSYYASENDNRFKSLLRKLRGATFSAIDTKEPYGV
jgi:uncharacterized caspase-like protein